MTINAVFVDLPNLFGSLIRSDPDRPDILRNYFLNWFDLDLLARHLTGENPNVWVFYSGQRLGPSEARVDSSFLKNYIARINSLQGITARDVNIPGDQREPIAVKCEKCGHDATTEWKSEKGIDSSLTVHLFDTMDYWDVAYLTIGASS